MTASGELSAPPPLVPGGSVASRPRLAGLGDLSFTVACMAAAICVPMVVALLVLLLFRDAWPSIQRFGFDFFVTRDWDVNQLNFGAVPFVFGTVVTSALAMLLAVPVSVASATFLAEIAPGWLRRSATFLTEMLAAIPSVVFGFWGISFVVPILQLVFEWLDVDNPTGESIFSASIILAIMIVPYVAAISYDVCRAVPASQREGALALGSTRWQMIWHVVLPYARPGIIGGSFLALGRALGETMAVVMLIGNRTKLNLDSLASLFMSIFGPGCTIPSVIANELSGADTEMHKAALIELGLVLFLVTVVVNCLARLLIWRMGRTRSAGFGVSSLFHRRTALIPAGADTARVPLRPSIFQRRFARTVDYFMTTVLALCVMLTVAPLFHVFAYVAIRGYASVDLAFFTHLPGDDTRGLGHALVGTGVMVLLATLAAVPVGVLAALFLTEYRHSRLANPVRFLGELLAGVPSIVVGVFAYALLVKPWGFSAWAGAFALAVLMVPTVMRASEEALRLVPGSLRDASLALGASHSQTVWRVIVPSALPAIVTGVFLAMARVAGETAPLLFTAYNRSWWLPLPSGLNERTPFLTYYIYDYAMSDVPENHRLAWAAAFVLLLLIVVLNVGIRLLTGRRVLQASRAA